MADMVLVSFHCHENGATRDQPPEFLETFARACIEEGADAFIGHGPHVTRGIEIYNGRPIFYSLGNFIFQNETVRWQPAHNYELVKLDHTATPADFYAARSEDDTRWFPSDPICWESIAAQSVRLRCTPSTWDTDGRDPKEGVP
jgi:poly-gamma-glutamate synthesis protein (capsule biosynthesis protein)